VRPSNSHSKSSILVLKSNYPSNIQVSDTNANRDHYSEESQNKELVGNCIRPVITKLNFNLKPKNQGKVQGDSECDLEKTHCCICQNSYNKQDRAPLRLSECKHTICLSCYNSILRRLTSPEFECPFDRIPQKNIPVVNTDLLPKKTNLISSSNSNENIKNKQLRIGTIGIVQNASNKENIQDHLKPSSNREECNHQTLELIITNKQFFCSQCSAGDKENLLSCIHCLSVFCTECAPLNANLASGNVILNIGSDSSTSDASRRNWCFYSVLFIVLVIGLVVLLIVVLNSSKSEKYEYYDSDKH